jgi:hypothetical protein
MLGIDITDCCSRVRYAVGCTSRMTVDKGIETNELRSVSFGVTFELLKGYFSGSLQIDVGSLVETPIAFLKQLMMPCGKCSTMRPARPGSPYGHLRQSARP